MANEAYELEINWGTVKAKGTVKVTVIADRAHHNLYSGSTHLAEFTCKIETVVKDEGETFILRPQKQSIGKGNLLAAVLLAEAAKVRQEIKVNLREHFPELFGG
jgi:hypothetical protein